MRTNILPISILMTFCMITMSYADNANIATSKGYVDDMIDTTQVKIPAAGANGVGLGESVMTYTAGGNGAIGERGIYTDPTSYDASSDADKIITAGALNTAFTTLPTTTTSKLVCQNGPSCTLWSIVDQTAYGASASGGGNAYDFSWMVDEGFWDESAMRCYYNYNQVGPNDVSCGSMTPGDWYDKHVVDNVHRVIRGVSACSTVSINSSQIYAYYEVSPNQSGVQSDYESGIAMGRYCYCKLTGVDDVNLSAQWVSLQTFDDAIQCGGWCADNCSEDFQYDELRDIMLGTVQ